MKLLQNVAGNFLNMTPQEAKKLAVKLVEAAEACLVPNPDNDNRLGRGFVQTIVLQAERPKPASPLEIQEVCLDTIFFGVNPTWIDVHPTLEDGLKPRVQWIMNIDRNDVNVRLKGQPA